MLCLSVCFFLKDYGENVKTQSNDGGAWEKGADEATIGTRSSIIS